MEVIRENIESLIDNKEKLDDVLAAGGSSKLADDNGMTQPGEI